MMEAKAETQLEALMAAALDGDAQAYRAVLGNLQARLGGFVGRRVQDGSDAEDIVQDILMAIHTRRHTYDRALPLLPWVYAIARYKLIDHYRSRGRRIFIALDNIDDPLPAPDTRAAADAQRDVEWALAQLPRRTAQLVRSLKLEGLSVAQTAARNTMSEGAVKVAMHRGLKALAKLRGPLSGRIGEEGHD